MGCVDGSAFEDLIAAASMMEEMTLLQIDAQ